MDHLDIYNAMNKKVILAMGLPLAIKSSTGRKATVELSSNGFVICRYHPDNRVYLSDANLNGWYPVSPYKWMLYTLKIALKKKSEALNSFLFKYFP